MPKRKTIKHVVFAYVHKNLGVINYNELTKKVLTHFPNSKWKYSHWSYYRYHLLKGRFSDEISEEERENLESYRKTKNANLH